MKTALVKIFSLVCKFLNPFNVYFPFVSDSLSIIFIFKPKKQHMHRLILLTFFQTRNVRSVHVEVMGDTRKA